MERSLEATLRSRSADVPPKARDSSPKDGNNHLVRDFKANRQRSISETENLRQNEARYLHEVSNISLERYRLCKPLCVHLSRLPDSVVNKYRPLTLPAPGRKKKRLHRWKHGEFRKKRRRKKLSILPTSRKSQLPADSVSKVEAIADPIWTSGFEFSTTESSGEKCSEEINQTESEERSEICGFTPQDHTLPVRKFELLTTETNEVSRTLDHITSPDFSKEEQIHITKSPDEHQSATENPNNIPAPSLQEDNNTNGKTSLRTNRDQGNQLIFKHVKKRRLSTDIDASKERKTLQRSKKYKRSATVSSSGHVMLAEESNRSISEDDFASIQHEQVLPELKKHDSKFTRSRRKSNRTNLNKAMIVVNRLDCSHSPLVQKWKDKVRLPNIDGALISTITHPENRVTCLSNDQLDESRLENSTLCSDQNVTNEETSTLLTPSRENDVNLFDTSKSMNGAIQANTCAVPEVNQLRPPEGEPIHIETIMCDSNDDEDDDEIMEFLSTRRRVRRSIDSSSSESTSTVQENGKPQSGHIDVKTPLRNGSSSEVLSYQQQRKTPSVSRDQSTKTLSSCKRRTKDWVDNSNSENMFCYEEVRSPPVTRSKSRAAMENANYESIFCSNEDSADQTRESEAYDPYEPSKNFESRLNKNLFANGSMRNTPNPRECELSRENNNLLDGVSRVHSDISRIDVLHTECSGDDTPARRKFSALKNAMVVLTRLEDYIDLSGDKEYPCGKLKFKATKNFGFLAYFSQETVENDCIDLQSDNSVLSYPIIDPLETEYIPVNQISGSAPSVPRKTVNLDLSIFSSKQKSQQNATISRNERIQDQSDNRSQEMVESDVEMSLFLDEADKASPESVTCNLSEGILTDLNGSNDRLMRAPCVPCPEDLDEHCKRCHCEEHQRDNRRLKCQNIFATHKCITCNSLFKDSEELVQHRTSNAFCNSGFRCTVCKTNYMTLIELAKHRVDCAEKGRSKRNSVEQISNQESITESRPAESTISGPPQSKNKEKKQESQKNSWKQGRSRPRCRVDNLTCSVCSINFETRSALSEHIFKHSAEELQEAYRIAKIKAMADSQVASEQRKKNESTNNINQLADSQVDGQIAGEDERPQKSTADPAQMIVSSVASIVNTTVSNDSLETALAMICLCHRDNTQTPMDTTDLQIEIVLLCKYCHVLFRRRECLEVHYRTSSHCASDRTRERWARLFCANCQLTLHSWADMRRHLEVHARRNAEGTVRFVCNICRVVFVGFGALFYNHWFNHLKDTMFVAGRYNFPKVSVQPIDGSEKLPAGARSDESYIFVAEHVCASCKKPFSTRRDLETHTENSSSCRKKNMSLEVEKGQTGSDVPRLSCDVCNLTFSDRKALNDHGRTGHDHRFIHVSSSPSSTDQNFMCTHCSATKKSVRALEEHWKTHLVRNPVSSLVETARAQIEAAKEPALVTSSVDDDEILKNQFLNALLNHANGVTPTQPRTTHEPTVITIEDEDITPENNATVFQAAIETPIVRTRLNNQESVSVPSISSTESNSATINSTTLRDLLKKAPLLMKAVENHRAEVRALEDSCTNPILSGETGTNVSASLVLNETFGNPRERTVDDTHTGSYVLLSNQPLPGSIKMALGRRHVANAAEKCPSPPTGHPSGGVNDKATMEDVFGSKATVDEVTTLAVIQNSVIDNTIECCLNVAGESDTNGEGNNYSSKLVQNDKSKISRASLLKHRFTVPEIIDIGDEVEEIGQETASNVNDEMQMQHSGIDSLHKNKENTGLEESDNSGSTQLDEELESMKIDGSFNSAQVNRTSDNASGSEACSKIGNGSIRDRWTFYSRASKASTMSFEEARWMSLTATNLNDNDSTASQKQGFLRVKNLSELRAVKTHVCLSCDARFESPKSLREHQQAHMCGVLDKDVHYPKGITAALVLPDSSERPKTPENTPPVGRSPTAQPSHAAQLIGVLSSHASAETRSPNVVNNDSIGPWIHVGSQQAPASVTQVETANTVQNVSILMELGSQQQINNPLNNVIPPILISSAGIAQSQDSIAIQQTSAMPSVGTIVIPENNQRLHENRTGTIGFHVLPPMVVLPSSQTTKQQPQKQRNVSNPTSSNNYLPMSSSVHNSPVVYQGDGLNKLLCNICHTFQCDTLEAFNSHVTKHYTGWTNSTVTQNSIHPATAATTTPSAIVPITTSFTMRQETAQRVAPDITSETNQIGSSIFNNWTVKDTPHGPLLVTSVSAAISEQTMTSFVINNNRSILRPAVPTTNNSLSSNGQIVYRCMICKSALYKTYPPLRNHVILVHGITDFASRGVENIVQKSYHCTQCPATTALFDSEEKFRAHVDTIHTHACPSCRRSFVSFLSLKSHLEHCRVSACNNRNGFGSKC